MIKYCERTLAAAVLRQAITDVCICMDCKNFNQNKQILLYDTIRWVYGDSEWLDYWCERAGTNKEDIRKFVNLLLNDKKKRLRCIKLLGIHKVK